MWFCNETCYNCFNICDVCKTIKKLSEAEEKIAKFWTKNGWGIKNGKITCSAKCRETAGKPENNFDPSGLPNCHQCKQKNFRINEDGTYTTYGFYGSDEIFCSAECRKKWWKEQQGQQNDQDEPQGENESTPTFTETSRPTNRSEGGGQPNFRAPNSYNTSNQDNNEIQEPEDNSLNIPEIPDLSLAQSQAQVEQRVEKLLKDNHISKKELSQIKLLGGVDWKDHLKSLDTPAKLAEFMNQMKQEVFKLKLASRQDPNQDKNPKNKWVLPLTIVVLCFLALTSLVLIIQRRRRKQRGF